MRNGPEDAYKNNRYGHYSLGGIRISPLGQRRCEMPKPPHRSPLQIGTVSYKPDLRPTNGKRGMNPPYT